MEEINIRRLATYNSEVSRGIVHTAEYDRKMKRLQQEYTEERLNMPGIKYILQEAIKRL